MMSAYICSTVWCQTTCMMLSYRHDVCSAVGCPPSCMMSAHWNCKNPSPLSSNLPPTSFPNHLYPLLFIVIRNAILHAFFVLWNQRNLAKQPSVSYLFVFCEMLETQTLDRPSLAYFLFCEIIWNEILLALLFRGNDTKQNSPCFLFGEA